jgi:hypothetical protein
MSIYAEPHHFSSETLPWLHLKTGNGITHAGWSDSRSADDNDAMTLCGLALHHCDLQRCRHPNRHRTRTFSRLVLSEVAEIDCMACVAASLGLENQ